MFPAYMTGKLYPQQRKRKTRYDLDNRDYICPCGKSYLSYPALFTHIKQKHNSRAPGKIIKPQPQGNSKRGRPRTKDVYDEDSESDDDAGNIIDNLCDYVTDIQRKAPSELKKLCTSSDFYIIYANHKEPEPKFNEEQDLYEDTCDHILCEFLVEINRRELDPSLFDELFMFMILFARCLNECNKREEGKSQFTATNNAKDIVDFVNPFILDYLPRYVREYGLENKEFFQTKHIMKVIEYLFNWLLMKKYTGHKLNSNSQFKSDT